MYDITQLSALLKKKKKKW